jgi:hypothetical protein
VLEKYRPVTFDENGHHFVDMSRLTMLLCGPYGRSGTDGGNGEGSAPAGARGSGVTSRVDRRALSLPAPEFRALSGLGAGKASGPSAHGLEPLPTLRFPRVPTLTPRFMFLIISFTRDRLLESPVATSLAAGDGRRGVRLVDMAFAYSAHLGLKHR